MNEGIRITGGLASITVAATTTTLHTISTGKRAIIKKIRVNNRQGANVNLTIGYNTLAAVWTPVMPNLVCMPGENSWSETDLPICGNTPEGFQADSTAVTGFGGNIAARASAAAVSPNDIQVQIEVEEI